MNEAMEGPCMVHKHLISCSCHIYCLMISLIVTIYSTVHVFLHDINAAVGLHLELHVYSVTLGP